MSQPLYILQEDLPEGARPLIGGKSDGSEKGVMVFASREQAEEYRERLKCPSYTPLEVTMEQIIERCRFRNLERIWTRAPAPKGRMKFVSALIVPRF